MAIDELIDNLYDDAVKEGGRISEADQVCRAGGLAELLKALAPHEEVEQPLHRREGESYGDWSKRVAQAFNDIWDGLGINNRTELFPTLWRVVTEAHGWED